MLLPVLACGQQSEEMTDSETSEGTATSPSSTGEVLTTGMETTSSPGTDTTSTQTTTTTTPTTDPTTASTTDPSTGPTTDDSTTDDSTTDDPNLCPEQAPDVVLPRQGLQADELGVLVNLEDPQSVAIAEYYVEARAIPAENVVELTFPVNTTMTPEVFGDLKQEVDDLLGDHVQALALTWTRPYRVGCMSATAAFALGFDDIYCNTSGMVCGETAYVDYFDSESTQPADDHGLRPTMMLAATNVENAATLIDRGIAADATFPTGDGYMIRTTDEARSVRWPAFISTLGAWDHDGGLGLTYIDNSDGQQPGGNLLTNTENVLFYLTGLANVGQIDTNTYVPGALADHLTSYGGQVPESSQMSVVRWLEAGATASYGTVVEPCNYPTKFPDPTVLLPHYFRGNTAVEAYWKSVAWPGEGNFVGEPLAAPWGASMVSYEDCTLTIDTTMLDPSKTYRLEQADAPDGPWEPAVDDISIDDYARTSIVHGPIDASYYRLVDL